MSGRVGDDHREEVDVGVVECELNEYGECFTFAFTVRLRGAPRRTSAFVVRAGSCDVFSALIGAKGRDVLYCGDHIFGDILKSKKIRGWRTFLVVPEMTHELYVWSARRDLQQRLQALDARLNDAYHNMDSSSTTAPDTRDITDDIQVGRSLTLLVRRCCDLVGTCVRRSQLIADVMRFVYLMAVVVWFD